MSRRSWLILTLALILALPIAVFAGIRWVKIDGTITDQTPSLVLSKSNVSNLQFKVHLSGLEIREIPVEGEVWNSIGFDQATWHSMPGEPEVPVFSRWIAIPQGATPKIKVNASNARMVEDVYPYPAQPPHPDCYGEPEPDFAYDSAIYSSDDPFPGQLFAIEGPYVIRGLQMMILRLYPVQVQPLSGRATVFADMEVSIEFEGSKGNFFSANRGRSFQSLYDLALNRQAFAGEALPPVTGKSPSGAEFVILTAPIFEDAVQDLADWKILQGYDTEVYTTDDSGTSVSSIKAWVQNAYDTWDPAPEFILFFGDTDFIPLTTDGTPSDLYYTTVDGGDEWADILSGRISVDTVDQAEDRIADIVNYERFPIDDDDFYTNSVHCAYFQHAGGGYAERRFARTTEETYRWFDEYLADSPYVPERIYYTGSSVNPKYWNQSTYQWTPLWWTYGDLEIPEDIQKPNLAWNGSNTDIANAVNAGTAFLTHRDHGSMTAWSEPAFDVSDINALTNSDKLPVVWSINCSTGQFDSDVCFSEAWERHPNGGAVGVIASTRVSYSGRNDRMFWGWLDSMWPDFEPEWPTGDEPNDPEWRHGILLQYGKMYMSYHYSTDPYRMTAIEEFHWFGDPTMEMWAGIPEEFSPGYMPIIPLGSTTFNVDVGVEGALVATVQNGLILGKAYSDGTGVAQVVFDGPISELEDVHLTITRRNYRPFEDDVMVGATEDGIVDLDKDAYCETDTVNIVLSDADLAGQSTYVLHIDSDTETAGEDVTCDEFETTGTFFCDIDLTVSSPADANGILSISDGDTITVYYHDDDNGSGSPEDKTDTAYGDTAAPTFAGLVSADAGNHVVDLEWVAGSDLTPPITYYIYRAEFSGGQNFAEPIGSTTEITYSDTGLPNFVEFYYVVRAADAFGHEETNTVEAHDMTVGPVVIWEEDFDDADSGIPGTWEIVNAGGGNTWQDDNPGNRTSDFWDGIFVVVDPDEVGGAFEQWDDALITEAIDTFGYVDIKLAFGHRFEESSGILNSHAIIDISNDNGVTWHEVANWKDDREQLEELDINQWAAGATELKIRFHYTSPPTGEYWGIDNIEVQGTPNTDPPEADFMASVTSGNVPLDVLFTPDTQGVVSSYLWDFGDGDTTNEITPTHTFEDPGTYTVSLHVEGPYGNDDEVKNDYIEVTCADPVLDFEADVLEGDAPLEVNFTDLSTHHAACGPNTIGWDFGDGETSTDENPTHVYEAPGTYTVKLVYQTDYGNFNKTKNGYITVECGVPDADFSADATEGDAPLTVQFTDLSVAAVGCDITSWQWGFGDELENLDTVDEQNPTYTFVDPGQYHVLLRVTNVAGTEVELREDYITVNEPGDDDTADDDIGDDDIGDDDIGDDDVGDDDIGVDDDDDDDDGCGC